MQTDMLIKYISRMKETLTVLGFDPKEVFAREEWSDEHLSEMTAPALQREQYKMIRIALRVSRREDLGILVGQSMSLTDFGPLGMLVATSSTMRVAFERVFRFLSIAEILWSADFDFDSDVPFVSITFQDSVPQDLHEYFLDEFAAAWNRFAGDLMGDKKWATAYYLPRPQSPERLAKSEALGIPFVYDQSAFRFDFDRDVLEKRIPNANPVVAPILEQQCALIEKGLPSAQTEVERIRRIVLDRLPEIPDVSEIASTLNTSERSLRRICARNGTTPREIILDVRLATACNHLRNSRMTIDEVSFLVGYGNPSSFYHAFRNWAGITPSEYRDKEIDLNSPNPREINS